MSEHVLIGHQSKMTNYCRLLLKNYRPDLSSEKVQLSEDKFHGRERKTGHRSQMVA
jgi:hypothetical protein